MAYEPRGEYQQQGEWGGVVQYGNDKHLVVMFYVDKVHNALKSQQAGAPIYDAVDFVKIHHPGEQGQVIIRPATEQDKRRFRDRWDAFEKGREQLCDGVPIDVLFPTRPDTAANLRSFGVHTIEQCANMSATALDNIGMGAQEYKNRAKDWMEAASAGANYHKFNGELEGLRRENARLKRDIEQMSAQFNLLTAQLRAGNLLDRGAMFPQQAPVVTPPPASEPIRGEHNPAMQAAAEAPKRRDMLADVPVKGKITKPWLKEERSA